MIQIGSIYFEGINHSKHSSQLFSNIIVHTAPHSLELKTGEDVRQVRICDEQSQWDYVARRD